ncbi:MAG: hypothetical protein B1H05_05225 [Candidatus Cloacimonas sp. 4484_140]|nr:MAG: hypothetical protein B1H05_05225 [Candidatus Cloacimonas sp. 4484_140]
MKKTTTGYLIIASAIVWGAVLILCAIVLKGTPYIERINRIVIGGAVFHLLFIWAPLGKQFRAKKEENSKIEKTDSEDN